MNEKETSSEKLDYFSKILEFYKKTSKKVHIELNNGRFYNGFVNEIYEDSFILNDTTLGEMPIFFSQIKVVEAYIDRELPKSSSFYQP